jgi:hypothetical protein
MGGQLLDPGAKPYVATVIEPGVRQEFERPTDATASHAARYDATSFRPCPIIRQAAAAGARSTSVGAGLGGAQAQFRFPVRLDGSRMTASRSSGEARAALRRLLHSGTPSLERTARHFKLRSDELAN